jgi:hypothetical protein
MHNGVVGMTVLKCELSVTDSPGKLSLLHSSSGELSINKKITTTTQQ